MDEKMIGIVNAFCLPAGQWQAEPFGNGHINRTYRVFAPDAAEKYILQWINPYVFHHPEEVQENILAVTNHLRRKIQAEGGDPLRETLSVIPTKTGRSWTLDETGGFWRMFLSIEDTYSMDLPDSEARFENCGEVFGRFQRRLDDFPAQSLHETIPHFHDTPWRLENLEAAARKDEMGRLKEVGAEVAFCLKRAVTVGLLTDGLRAGRLPLRVTHNDTKLNNALLDRRTGRAICVVDLDTVMPGLMAYDYGEAIRTGANLAAEDERDLEKVQLSMPLVKAYTRGFLREVGSAMTREEIASLPWGARMMTLENGMRFLTDYLEGDRYFAIHRPGQNLDRARAQMTLVKRMEEQWDEMLACLEV